MPAGRRILILVSVALGLTGCRAAGTGSLSLTPRPSLTDPSFDLARFVAEHNRNAQGIVTLTSEPSITVASAWHRPFPVSGHMAVERPRNFDLDLSVEGTKVADIGSNSDEFWFWVINKNKNDDKLLYWCNYEDLPSSNLAVTYQPDWIIDALGLRPISPEEAKLIRVSNGPETGTTRLSFPTTSDQGEPCSREMIVSTRDRRLKKLLVWSVKPKTLIAEASPGDYKEFSGGAGSSASHENYLVPQKLKLDWKREQLVLDATLKNIKLNQLDPERSAIIFVEPKIPGYQRKNLAQATGGIRPGRKTNTRNTIPPPESQDGVRLGRPAPMSDDESSTGSVGSATARDPSDDGTYTTFDEPVGAAPSRPPIARNFSSNDRYVPPGYGMTPQ
jgi:hypothetical protein